MIKYNTFKYNIDQKKMILSVNITNKMDKVNENLIYLYNILTGASYIWQFKYVFRLETKYLGQNNYISKVIGKYTKFESTGSDVFSNSLLETLNLYNQNEIILELLIYVDISTSNIETIKYITNECDKIKSSTDIEYIKSDTLNQIKMLHNFILEQIKIHEQ